MGASNFIFYLHNIFYKINASIKSSLWIALLVFFLHCTVIFFLLNEHMAERSYAQDSLIIFRLLQPDSSAHTQPLINLYSPPQIASPAVSIKLPDIILIDTVDVSKTSDKDFEYYNKNGSTIFDPRLRKKLNEMQTNASVSVAGLKTWMDSSGAQLVEVNEGKCIKSMVAASGSEHGVNWSLPFKCGRNESERMMDNINKDLTRRKKTK